MEKVIEHEIEHGLRAAPPRHIRATPVTGLLLLVAALLFVVFVYGGSRALMEAGKFTWLATRGERTTGTVAELIDSNGQPISAGPSAHAAGISYAYRSSRGEPGTGYASFHPSLAAGQPFPVRYAHWGRQLVSAPAYAHLGGSIVFLLLTGCVVIGVSGFLFMRMLRGVLAQAVLLKYGEATIGTVIHKTATTGDPVRYLVHYGYSDSAGAPREAEDACTIEQYGRFEVGQPVTVLYAKDSPDRAALYALVPFVCVAPRIP